VLKDSKRDTPLIFKNKALPGKIKILDSGRISESMLAFPVPRR